jgi:hypothetical protein
MRPITRGDRTPDQRFGESEKLYKRVPAEQLTADGRIEPSLIQCSFGKVVKSAPSVVRSKYACAQDAIRPGCANGKDVSSNVVFYLKVSALPKSIVSGDNRTFTFYPFHDPEQNCYAHTVIACRSVDGPNTSYDPPSNAVKNEFKAKLVAALERAPMLPFPFCVACEVRKALVSLSAPKRIDK